MKKKKIKQVFFMGSIWTDFVYASIYNKLKNELEDKKKNVEKTIKSAGEAYYNRNRAEEELKAL